MANTSFDKLIQRFLRRIEKDRDFFTYYNVEPDEAMSLAYSQATGYIFDAIDLLTDRCTPQIDFYNYDKDIEEFNFELTSREIGLLSSLMREVYFDRELSLLKAFQIALTPSDLRIFSPANERRTFVEMVNGIKSENHTKISKYIAEDRVSGLPRHIDYGLGQG
jgi:hypothetical protein